MQFIATNVEKKSIMSTKNLIYIAGPTGVGKTKLSLELAKRFDTEIISCDSRQFYKEMEIGTAVPTAEELKEVKHHFIQHKSIQEVYTVSNFEKEAVKKLDKLFKKKDTVIMVGGSGMYADAVMFGMDEFPEIPEETRNQINVFYQTHGLKGLQELLREKDPKYHITIVVQIKHFEAFTDLLFITRTSHRLIFSYYTIKYLKIKFTTPYNSNTIDNGITDI